MCTLAAEDPEVFSNNSVSSEGVITFYLYEKYVHPFYHCIVENYFYGTWRSYLQSFLYYVKCDLCRIIFVKNKCEPMNKIKFKFIYFKIQIQRKIWENKIKDKHIREASPCWLF